MKTDFDVLGVGNAIMDILAPVPESFLKTHDITKGGMTLIDEGSALNLNTALEASAETTMIAGGSAANTMVGIAEMGVRAAYVGKVGTDAIGKGLAQGYRDAGLKFDTPAVTSGAASGRCMIAVTPDAQRSMSTFLGATTELTRKDIKPADIRRAAIIYLEGYLFDSDEAKKAFVKAAEIA